MRDLLYSFLVFSGNDAGVAIAEHVGGSVEKFVDMMNDEVKDLGAIDSHFVNPHGLHDDKHYTTVYDLYLVFHELLQYDTFMDIINQPNYKAKYTDKDGKKHTKYFKTTDRYLIGTATAPKGVKVIGGKTGTTQKAGSCLILYSKDKKKLYIYPSGKTEKKFAIPSKVTKICRRAFYGNSIESVIMGNKLREIGRQAFAKTELKSVKLPKSLKIIEDSAFDSTQISSVELPKGLKRVGNHAFGNIKDLSTIIVRCNCKLNYVFADSGFQTNLQTYDRENYTDFRIVLGKELNATIYRLFADFADHIRLGKMKVEVEKGNKTYYIKDEAVYAKRGDRLKESFKKLNGKEQS